MSDFIGGLFAAILGIGLIILFFSGLRYAMNKFFGVDLTSRGNYNNRVRQNALEHKLNLRELSDIDKDTIDEAKKNLSKKFFAHTSSNILEEARIILNSKSAKPNFNPHIGAIRKYEILYAFIYKDAPYCSYYNGSTTYIKIINDKEGLLDIYNGEPEIELIDTIMSSINPYARKFEYSFDGFSIKFDIFHTGRKYWYQIYPDKNSKTPNSLKASRGISFSQTIIRLDFAICK